MSLKHYFETFFAMMQHHNYSLTELENMIPWERDIYTALLLNHLEKEREDLEKQERRTKNG